MNKFAESRKVRLRAEGLTKRLNEQVKRNIKRFPDDFMFQLTSEEKNELVANCDRFKTLKHSTVRRNLTHSAVISTAAESVCVRPLAGAPRSGRNLTRGESVEEGKLNV